MPKSTKTPSNKAAKPSTAAPAAKDAASPQTGATPARKSTKTATETGATPAAAASPAAASGPAPAPQADATRTGDTTAQSAAKPAGLPGPRRVRLSVSRIDPWSVVKFSFLISFAVGIMIVVAAAIFWFILDGMHVFSSINDTIAEIAGEPEKFNILQWVTLERTLSLATIIALIDIVVLTALSTIFSLLYNLTAMLVGGVSVTLTDE
ncbi:hypothetical protein GCM10010401_10570 [Rarobacter faecitabidus]|uniref:DUF3566 domain-containing protein n=1 Tax=Rarobacter faecitabidus TaxID=13243 RepID=UPI001FE3BEEA|nr:DUF3566 domain-containing protein [Rarobacter faecitabidus]